MLALRARDWSANGIAHSQNAQQARQHAGALGWRLTPKEHARIRQAEIASREAYLFLQRRSVF
jgi:hypothetical protein